MSDTAQQLADLLVKYVEEGTTDPGKRQSVLDHLRTRERSAAFLMFMDWHDPEDVKAKLIT